MSFVTRTVVPLLLLFASAPQAASLYVTSDTALNPAATSCTLGSPCHINDAIRIAESNAADDMVILVSPSTFTGAAYYTYNPDPSDVDRDFGIRVDSGAGLFDGNGSYLTISMSSRHGDLSVSGIQIRNSAGDYREGPAYVPRWNSALSIESDSGDVSIQQVTLWDNTRQQIPGAHHATAGARVQTLAGSVTVEDSLFLENRPGALRVAAEHVTLTDNNFLANQVAPADSEGQGAVRIDASTVDIEGNNFSGNRCAGRYYAAGLSINFEPDIPSGTLNSRIVDNRFLNNAGISCSGGLYLDGSRSTNSPTFVTRIDVDGNQFARNDSTDAPGAGIYALMREKTRLLLRNNVIYDNETLDGPGSGSLGGSAIDATVTQDAQLHLINNTITGNRLALAQTTGAAVNLFAGSLDSEVNVYNNIIWGNPTTVSDQSISDLQINGDINASVIVRNNDYAVYNFYNDAPGSGLVVQNNLTTDPGFVDAVNADFHLDASSTLIDVGSLAPVHLPTIDMDGQNRVQSVSVDIGADEVSGVTRRLVTLTKLGTGDGSVSSVPSGLACGVGCSSNSGNFDLGTTIGLLAVADTDSVFVGWGGDCAGTNAGTQLAINSPSHSCTAEFQPRLYRITITAAGPETGSVGSSFGPALNWFYPVGGNQRVVEGIPPGTSVTVNGLVSDPNVGHVFLDDCEAQGGVLGGQASGQATCTFNNISQDHAMRVNFNSGVVLFPFRTLSIAKSGLGNGSIVSTPSGIDCGATCSQGFFVDSNVSLTATPDGQSIFAGWSGDCPAGAGSVLITMDAAKSCTAEFIRAYNVDFSFSGSGSGNFADVYRAVGTQYPQWGIQYGARYPDGATLQFQANGNDSAVTFSGCDVPGLGMVLTGNGTSSASCSIGSLTQNLSIGITYSPNQSLLTVSASGTGDGSVSTDIGGIAFNFPATSAMSSQLTHGSNEVIRATGSAGATVHWTGCTGPGANIIGQGTTSSSCQIGIYQPTSVGVEFRSVTDPGSLIFRNGFE